MLNKRRSKKGLPEIEAISSEQNPEECAWHFVNIGFDRSIPIANGITFIDAGHILGSAQVILDIVENGVRKQLLFSGDVGRGDNDLLRDHAIASDVDYLIRVSTCGNREHDLPTQANHLLKDLLVKALEKNGKVIIPAFAVEWTQQLIYVLHEPTESGDLPDVSIYVDSPLAVIATKIYRIHPECFNEQLYEFLLEKRNPFGFESLNMVRKVTESRALHDRHKPAIIISASGMCEAGRILHHLRNNIGDEKNTILFVGYCDENTLGWKVRNEWEKFLILGDKFDVRADVQILDSFSGHADQSMLLEYFDRIWGSKEKVFLVHGEESQSEALCEIFQERHS